MSLQKRQSMSFNSFLFLFFSFIYQLLATSVSAGGLNSSTTETTRYFLNLILCNPFKPPINASSIVFQLALSTIFKPSQCSVLLFLLLLLFTYFYYTRSILKSIAFTCVD